MNIKEMEINYKRYLIFTKKDEIKSGRNTIQDYKINIAELVLSGAQQEDINKYVKFIEKHKTDIENLEIEIAKLVIEIDKLTKEINN